MMDDLFVRSHIRFYALFCVLILTASMACTSSPQAKEAKFLKRGQALMAKKDYNRAQLEFRTAAQAMPMDAEPYYQMALAYLATSNVSGAIGALRRAVELNPKHSNAQLKLAELMTASRNRDLIQEAATKLTGILAVSPDNTEAIDTLAMAQLHLGKAEDATKLLEESLSKFPTHLQSSVALARVKLAQGDVNAAEGVLKNAIATAPQSPQAALALAQLYALRGERDKAELEVRRALQLEPNNADALMSLARLQVAANRLDDAEQTYKQLSALPEKAYKPLHAIFLYQTGKKAAAMAEFEKLAKDDPEDRAARSRLVSIYFEMNKIHEAQQLLASALRRNPKDSEALFQRSELMLKLGKLSEADEDLKSVLRLQPDSAEAHYAAAGVYRAQGSKEMAKQELDSVLRLKPSFLQARLALARSYLLANQWKAALDLLEAAPASQKGTLGFVIERNWALLEAGETKEVQKILDRALHVGRVPELLFQESILRMQEHDYQGARLDAEEVLRSSPEDTRAVRIVVDTYVAQKDVPKATERLTEIVAARPGSGPLQQMLGLWYRSIGNLAQSRTALEKAKIADPKLLTADLALAGIDRQENHFDAARQRLAVVIKTAPKNVPALLESANVELEAGNREGAIVGYRTVLDVDSSNLMALNNLAYILALDNTDEALKLAQKATEIAPDSPAVQDTIGWVYYRRGNYLTAVNYFKTAVAKDPTPRRQFHLAMSYLKSGDQNLGQKMLQAALEKDPSLPKTEHGW